MGRMGQEGAGRGSDVWQSPPAWQGVSTIHCSLSVGCYEEADTAVLPGLVRPPSPSSLLLRPRSGSRLFSSEGAWRVSEAATNCSEGRRKSYRLAACGFGSKAVLSGFNWLIGVRIVRVRKS